MPVRSIEKGVACAAPFFFFIPLPSAFSAPAEQGRERLKFTRRRCACSILLCRYVKKQE